MDIVDRSLRALGQIFGSQGKAFLQDSVTSDLVHINHSHEEIHSGTKYVSSDVVTGLGLGATKQYLLIAPNTTTRIHILIAVTSTPGSTITLFEAPTKTANGTTLSILNKERNSTNTATLSVFKDPTITISGTQLQIEEIGSGTSSGKFGGSTAADRDEVEWILKQNISYLINIVTLAGSTDITTTFRWYEI